MNYLIQLFSLRISGNIWELSQQLRHTAEGGRLLSYIEAVKEGKDRLVYCDTRSWDMKREKLVVKGKN